MIKPIDIDTACLAYPHSITPPAQNEMKKNKKTDVEGIERTRCPHYPTSSSRGHKEAYVEANPASSEEA